ncbi:FN1 [Mytilus edulis]|uniref:FN1 n=1 Tax=Mytilus edulis TaxID=6550 RepID=A0A8S3QK42_MYTED|nr:FN1 [Mytilus edulis]
MKCETTEQFIDVNHGENLILNCTCFNKTNGQWVGPNKSPTLYTNADKLIPYTQGTELNPNLNRSKFRVLGGYDINQCQLQIMHFVSDDEDLDYHDANIFNVEWVMPLAVIILVFFVVTVVTMQINKADSVENRLYQSPTFLEINNFRRQNRVTRNEFVSSSQMHERYGATERTTREFDLIINEINLNYAEVMFDVERSPRHCIIHGNDERTIYSDIDHLSRAEPLPSSSSESEDD